MISHDDLYTWTRVYPLLDNGHPFGKLIADYHAQRYVLGETQIAPKTGQPGDLAIHAYSNRYLVSCQLRLVVPNASPLDLAPGSITGYRDYPAIVKNDVSLAGSDGSTVSARLKGYRPRTLNSAVNTSASSSQASQSGVSREHTSGSMSSQTNSFGFSLLPSFERSYTSGKSSSTTNTTSSEQSQQVADSDSMSIMDWGSYARPTVDYSGLSWLWAQEYPWDTLQYRNIDPSGNVILPQFVLERLQDGAQVCPPSQLSEFGLDVASSATWEVAVDSGTSVVFAHAVDYLTASHWLEPSPPPSPPAQPPGSAPPLVLVARINRSVTLPWTRQSDPIDLEQLALDPVGSGDPAAINFTADIFRVPPSVSQPFSVLSRSNNLLIRGEGFDDSMTADLSKGKASLKFDFKVSDERPYRLVLKHWRGQGSEPCSLTFHMPDGTAMEKVVDSDEAEGGENNLLRIDLRNNLYSSANYHNYLSYGLNEITVEITPSNKPPGTCTYHLVAAAIT